MGTKKQPVKTLPDLKIEGYRSRKNMAKLPVPDKVRLASKISRLSPVLKALFPDIAKLEWNDFWLTPAQAGRICGGICNDSVIARMYEGTAFFNTVNVASDPENQPYFRIPLEDCVDFLLERLEGAFEEQS